MVDSIPKLKNFIIVGSGSMLGEEDAISAINLYTCTARCCSMTGQVYSIDIDNFNTLKDQHSSWLKIVDKSLWKEHLKLNNPASLANSERKKLEEIRRTKPVVYDLSENHFERLRSVLA